MTAPITTRRRIALTQGPVSDGAARQPPQVVFGHTFARRETVLSALITVAKGKGRHARLTVAETCQLAKRRKDPRLLPTGRITSGVICFSVIRPSGEASRRLTAKGVRQKSRGALNGLSGGRSLGGGREIDGRAARSTTTKRFLSSLPGVARGFCFAATGSLTAITAQSTPQTHCGPYRPSQSITWTRLLSIPIIGTTPQIKFPYPLQRGHNFSGRSERPPRWTSTAINYSGLWHYPLNKSSLNVFY